MKSNYKRNIAVVTFSMLANMIIYAHIVNHSNVAELGLIGIVISFLGIGGMLEWADESNQHFELMVEYKQRFTSIVGLSLNSPPKSKRHVFSLKSIPKTFQDSKSGYVYVIQEKSQGHYKIGRTLDPNSRMQTFSLKLPFKIEYLYVIEAFDMYKLESQLHKLFEEKHVNGEWFSLSAYDLLWIENNCNPIYVSKNQSENGS